MPDLKDFTDAAADRLGFQVTDDPRRPRTVEQIAAAEAARYVDVDADPMPTEADDQAEGEDGAAPTDAFWRSLSDADYASAQRSETVRDGLLAAFLADEDQADDADDTDESEDDDELRSGLDVIRVVFENAADLVDDGGAPISPRAWLAGWVDASPAAWAKALRSVGWPASTPQPSHADLRSLGLGLQGEVLAESWAAHVARLQEQGRKFGE